MTIVRIAVDVEYLDGTLAGLTIPAGYAVTVPESSVPRIMRWIAKVTRENDFVRATGTGNRYRFASYPMVTCIDA